MDFGCPQLKPKQYSPNNLFETNQKRQQCRENQRETVCVLTGPFHL